MAPKKVLKLSEIHGDLFDSESDSDNDKENQKRKSSSSDTDDQMETEDRKSERGSAGEDDEDSPVEMSAALKRRLKMVQVLFYAPQKRQAYCL